MGRKRGSFRRCTTTRDNGKPCNGKALRHSQFCCKHDKLRQTARKTPEKRSLLFHLFFVYGYLRYGNVEFLKAEVSGARGAWQHIAHHVFGDMVNNATVQAHANRYKQWMEHNGMRSLADVARAIRDARTPSHSGKTCVSIPRLHTFLRFNEYTLPDLFRYGALIMINGVPYRLDESGPVRVDEAFLASGIRNDFCTLQALDGYYLSVGMRAWRTSTACPQLQQECLSRLQIGEAPGGVPTEIPEHTTLAATCVDALDDSGTAWQGRCARAIDCSHLALALTTVTQPREAQESRSDSGDTVQYRDAGESDVVYGDMPQLTEFTSMLEGWGQWGSSDFPMYPQEAQPGDVVDLPVAPPNPHAPEIQDSASVAAHSLVPALSAPHSLASPPPVSHFSAPLPPVPPIAKASQQAPLRRRGLFGCRFRVRFRFRVGRPSATQ